MNMKQDSVLYISYILQRGHINFDGIHIRALQENYDVKVVAHQEVAEALRLPQESIQLLLPRFLAKDFRNGLLNRILFLLTLLLIKIRVHASRFDHVVVSSTDEITLALLPPCSGMHLVCHRGEAALQNGVKRFFMKQLAKRNDFIVFSDHMKAPFLEKGLQNVHVVSHGCVAPFAPPKSGIPKEIPREYKTLLFHPSPKPDKEFLSALYEDTSFRRFLQESDTLLVVRGAKQTGPDEGNILVLNRYLSQDEYQALLLSSHIILMAYPPSFSWQASGVSYECVACGKKALILSHPSLAYCKSYYNYDPFFTTLRDLEDKIRLIAHNPAFRCIADAESLKPDYTEVFAAQRNGTTRPQTAQNIQTHV